MMDPQVIIFDYETEAVAPRPLYPPEPAGVAIQWPGEEPMYLAWGHRSGGNNCLRDDAVRELRRVWDSGLPVIAHNAPFEMAVSCERIGLPMLTWNRIHDTQTLLFLYDPHAKTLSLKPSAERLLDWKPEERDEVHEWIWEHRKEILAEHGKPGQKITRAKSGANSPAAWIAYAPGDLVARYAMGDVRRTLALFKFLYPKIVREGMLEAYDRERKIMPILLENEQRGLRVDLEGLRSDVPKYQAALDTVEERMRGYLGASGLDFNKDRDVASAFEAVGAVHEDRWVSTDTGQLSVSKDNLPPDAFTDPLLASAYGYRNRLVTCLKMFMQPWIEQAETSKGYIYPQWNQIRGERGGTRTGRPSMSKPNLLNVAKDWSDKNDGYIHPAALEIPELPLVRTYILPDDGHEFLHRDFDGQELRIFAHFESGPLLRAYLGNPALDPHSWVGDKIFELMGVSLERRSVKIMNFQSLYGGGVTAISSALGCSNYEAKEFKVFHDTALPGRKILSEEIQRIVRRGEPIRTWGGRIYYVEPPGYSAKHKRHMTYDYKLINYLIQGSAADLTKEAIIDWYYEGGPSGGARFLLTVYDEINISAPRGLEATESMAFLKDVMERPRLDVPMRSSGKRGQSWGTAEKCE